MKGKRNKILLSLGLLFTALLLMVIPMQNIPLLDRKGEEYFSSAIKKAILTYAVVRGVNATVSLVKDADLTFSMGGGLTVPFGRIMDPIDDATERLSSLVTYSIVSLGVVRLIYDIFKKITPRMLSILLLLLIPAIWLDSFTGIRTVLTVAIILGVLRFSLPVSGLVNSYLQDNFFQPGIDKEKRLLKRIVGGVDIPDDPTIAGKVAYYTGRIKFLAGFLWKKRSLVVNSIVDLMVLYAGILIIQVFLIPLVFFWMGFRFLYPLLIDAISRWYTGGQWRRIYAGSTVVESDETR